MKPELLTDLENVIQYNLHSELQTNWAQVSLLNRPIQGPVSVLDIGCGDGKITAALSKEVPFGRVVGLDISKEMIHFASGRFSKNNYPNLSFVEGDVLNLPFEGEFDFIVSFSALNWMEDQAKVLRNIYSSLKTGGKVLLVIPGNSEKTLKSLGDLVRQRPEWKDHFLGYAHNRWYFSTADYHQLLEQAGFSQISVRWIDTEIILESREELKNWWSPVSTAVQYLPPNLRPSFLEEVIQLYLSFYPADASGKVVLHWPKIEAVGVK